MSVPTNLIPSPITGLQEYTGTSTLGYLPYVLEGRSYKVQFANIAAVGAVPSSRVIAAGTGLAGGGDLTTNRVISIANGGVGFDQLASSGVTQGTYGSGSAIPIFTVDAKGRVTSATTAALDVTGFVPTSRTITAGDGLTGGGSLANNISLAANFSAATPSALGTASAGTAITVSRGDHVHPAVNLSDTSQTQGALPLGRGGTGDALSPVAGAVVYSTGTKFALTNPGIAGQVLVSGGTDEPQWRTVEGAGTVTSVNASGGATGLSFTGGPITVSGTLTLGGTLAVANGGTGATAAAAARTNLGAAASGANTDITSIALTTGTISTSPVNGTDIVNKVYADSIASGINFHQSVRLATAAALPANTYNNGTSGVGATLTGNANGALTVDGVAAVAGNRILVKNEAAGANNGVYTVTQVGSGAAPYILTRATDFDSAGTGVDQIDAGDFFLVTAGSTQANTSWVQQTPLPIVVGTTALVFTQFAAPVLYSAGTGLTLAGTVFSLTAPVTVALGGTGATTLSSGYLVKGNGTSAVSASVVYDNGTNVGIGTSSPSFPLDVQSTGIGSSIAARIYRSDGTIALLRIGNSTSGSASNAPAFGSDTTGAVVYTGNAERMRVDSAGNVGIGTASPATLLHISATNPEFRLQGTNGTGSVHKIRSTGLNSEALQITSAGDTYYNANLQVFRAANEATEYMRINSAGNVGIGTSAPAARLHVVNSTVNAQFRLQDVTTDATNKYGVVGTGHYTNAQSPILAMGVGSLSASNTIYIGGGFGSLNAATAVSFYTAANNTTLTGTERMRIDNAGRILIGTATGVGTDFVSIRFNSAGSYSQGLNMVDSNASANGTYYQVFRKSDDTNIGLIRRSGTDNAIFVGGNSYLTLGSGDTERMRIDSSGNVGIGTTTPAQKLSVAGTIESTSGGVIVPDQLAYDYATSNLPTTRPALSLDFADVGALDPRVTFTRASTATFVGSNGLIQTAAINAPRFDYDPVTLAAKGLLIEEQRTNLLTYSEDFTNAAWVVNGSPVITANAAVAPDGTSTADTMAVSGSSNGFGVYRNVVSSGTYASSIYFKLVSGAFSLRVGLTSNFSVINCSTLAITNTGTGVGSVSAVGNGWYRFVSVGTISVLSASEFYNIGSNTGTLAIWGAQLEAGAFATSYIPTVASTVTRTSDFTSIVAPNFAPWYNQSEGTFVVDVDSVAPATLSVALTALSANDGGFDNRNRVLVFSNFFTANTTVGGVNQSGPIAGVYAPNTPAKVGYAYKTDDFALSVGGGAPATDTSGTVPTALNRLDIGLLTPATGQFLNGHIRSITYYNTRLPNAVLQGITS